MAECSCSAAFSISMIQSYPFLSLSVFISSPQKNRIFENKNVRCAIKPGRELGAAPGFSSHQGMEARIPAAHRAGFGEPAFRIFGTRFRTVNTVHGIFIAQNYAEINKILSFLHKLRTDVRSTFAVPEHIHGNPQPAGDFLRLIFYPGQASGKQSGSQRTGYNNRGYSVRMAYNIVGMILLER